VQPCSSQQPCPLRHPRDPRGPGSVETTALQPSVCTDRSLFLRLIESRTVAAARLAREWQSLACG
jgi:hypothetical protein